MKTSGNLSRSLLKAVLLVSFFFSFITTGVQLFMNYQSDVSFINKQIDNIETSLADPLALAIWTIDREQINTLTKGVLDLEDVVRVQLVAEKSKVDLDLHKESEEEVTIDLVHKKKLSYGSFPSLGELTIYVSYRRPMQNLWSTVFVILMTQLIKTICVSLVLLAVFNWMVVDPLRQILKGLAEVKGDVGVNAEAYEVTIKKKVVAEEFSELVSGVNLMISKIKGFTLQKKKEDQEAQGKYEEMLHGNRLITMGGISAELAHEVNNPNGAILFNASTLKRLSDKYKAGDFDNIEDVDECIMEILEASARINGVIEQLKKYTGKGGGIKVDQPFKPIVAIESAVHILQYKLARKNIVIELSDNSGGQGVMANPLTFEQAIVNLLDNAFHAVPDKGGLIDVSIMSDETDVLISIKDNGVGIKDEMIEVLSKAYITTRGDEGGTGLGLYVTMRIIKEHDGSLSFLANENGGTNVIIKIPKLMEK